MKKIASFEVNHLVLEPGIYLSRQDGDVITYDLRFKKPNAGEYLDNGALHTIEHLLATYVRNSAFADRVVYAGPMGCRTGFYLLLRDSVSSEETIALVRAILQVLPGRFPETRKESAVTTLIRIFRGPAGRRNSIQE